MNVKCIDDKNNKRITKGNEYKVVGVMIQIIDDLGCKCSLDAKRFELCSQDSRAKIHTRPNLVINSFMRI